MLVIKPQNKSNKFSKTKIAEQLLVTYYAYCVMLTPPLQTLIAPVYEHTMHTRLHKLGGTGHATLIY